MIRLTSEEALRTLDQLEDDRELLGLDGFRVREGGFEASLDLILDLTTGDRLPSTHAQRVAEAKEFIIEKNSPDVLWEVCTS